MTTSEAKIPPGEVVVVWKESCDPEERAQSVKIFSKER